MLGPLKAEWRKTTRNYLVTSFLVWVYPVGITAWMVCMLLISFVSENTARSMITLSSGFWTRDLIAVWGFVLSFPANVLGRLLPVAFMAVVFGGEYQWGTWRNIVPRNHRAALMISKFLTASTLVLIAFIATGLITAVGYGLGHALVDLPYEPSFSNSEALAVLKTFAGETLLGMLALLLLASFAALAAVLTRSLLGSLVASFGLAAVEPTSLLLLVAFGKLIGWPQVVEVYQITPTYHISNAESWILQGQAVTPYFTALSGEPSLSTSLLVVLAWVVGLAGVAILVFQRQDLTT